MKKKLENPDFARPVGKSSILRIDWKSWDKETPKSGQEIWVILKLKNGYYPVTGTYFDETLPANGPFKESRWRQIKFHDFGIPDIFVKPHCDKNQKRLVAWGSHKGVVRLGKNCKKCGCLPCKCRL